MPPKGLVRQAEFRGKSSVFSGQTGLLGEKIDVSQMHSSPNCAVPRFGPASPLVRLRQPDLGSWSMASFFHLASIGPLRATGLHAPASRTSNETPTDTPTLASRQTRAPPSQGSGFARSESPKRSGFVNCLRPALLGAGLLFFRTSAYPQKQGCPFDSYQCQGETWPAGPRLTNPRRY